MMRPSLLVAATALVLAGSSASAGLADPSPALLSRADCPPVASGPIPPKQDPWYTAPAGFEVASPGAILRIRSAPGNLTSVVGNSSAAYNILYRTTDSRYKPTWAVTTLFVPKPASSSHAAPGAGSLVSYQIPYDSNDLNASPSYQLYDSPPSDIANALGRGWYVNVPDFEGPLASFTAGVLSGHATLDSVRAVRAASFGLSPDARYAMWGYSGGALASEWAAELQVQYAPELNFSGAALGGLTPNVTSVMETITGQLPAGLIPESILGLSSQFPDVQEYVLSKLKTQGPYNKTAFLAARNYTLSQAELAYADQNISEYFVDGYADILVPKVMKIVNSDGQMGYHGVPQMPLYVYKAIHDEISPINDTDALVKKYCGIGATILYERNPVGGHAAEATNGGPQAVRFLESVFAGNFTMTGCKVEDIKVNITDSPLRRRWWSPVGTRMSE